MGFELGPKRSALSLLATPGPILAIIGAVILIVSFAVFNHSAPGGDVDAIIAAQAHSGARLKAMLGMVCGVVACIAGALWSLMTFTHGRK
jgi:hypothetical protein